MKTMMSLMKFKSRVGAPLLLFFGCITCSSLINAAELVPLPDFDCVIEPSVVTDLGSAVPGVIDKLYANRSDTVKKGEVVAALESSVAESNVTLSQARAELETSISLRKESAEFGQRTSTRNQALYEKSAISKQEIDKLNTENRIAYLQMLQEKDNQRIASLAYNRAKAVLDRHLILSPIEGVVMERFKSVGEYIEQDPVMRIAQIDPLHVEVILPVKYIGTLAPGRLAEVTPNIPGQVPYIATVTRVDKIADAASGTFGARLVLPNPDHAIPGGLRCNLTFLSADTITPLAQPEALPEVEQLDEQKKSEDVVTINGSKNQVIAAAVPKAQPEALLNAEQLDEQMSQIEYTETPPQAQPEAIPRGEQLGGAKHALVEDMSDSSACYRVGPLTNEKLTASLSDSISELDSNSHPVLDLEHNAYAGYRIFITSHPDKGSPEVLKNDLMDKGVENFYLITSGEHKGHISVGFFGSYTNATSYRARLVGKGLKAEMSEVYRESFWINLAFNSDQEFQSELKKLVKSTAPRAGIRLTQCGQQQISGIR